MFAWWVSASSTQGKYKNHITDITLYNPKNTSPPFMGRVHNKIFRITSSPRQERNRDRQGNVRSTNSPERERERGRDKSTWKSKGLANCYLLFGAVLSASYFLLLLIIIIILHNNNNWFTKPFFYYFWDCKLFPFLCHTQYYSGQVELFNSIQFI